MPMAESTVSAASRRAGALQMLPLPRALSDREVRPASRLSMFMDKFGVGDVVLQHEGEEALSEVRFTSPGKLTSRA